MPAKRECTVNGAQRAGFPALEQVAKAELPGIRSNQRLNTQRSLLRAFCRSMAADSALFKRIRKTKAVRTANHGAVEEIFCAFLDPKSPRQQYHRPGAPPFLRQTVRASVSQRQRRRYAHLSNPCGCPLTHARCSPYHRSDERPSFAICLGCASGRTRISLPATVTLCTCP